MILTDEQRDACDKLVMALQRKERVLVLRGPAGCGKTTLMRSFADRVRSLGMSCSFAAPTGKAALRLSRLAERPVDTVHKVLYRRVTESDTSDRPVFLDPQAPCQNNSVLVIDEASMVDKDIHEEIVRQLPPGSSVLYVGDPEQLPPVSGRFGPDFDHPTAELVTIHRQALENPILKIATDLRLGHPLPRGPCEIPPSFSRKRSNLQAIASWLADAESRDEDAVVLCWTNDTRQRINRLTRNVLGFSGLLCEKDRIVVLVNNKALRRHNGECLVVKKIVPFMETSASALSVRTGRKISSFESNALKVVFDDDRQALVHPDYLGTDPAEFRKLLKTSLSLTESSHWLHIDYGHALTVHKSQGSEWAIVGFVIDFATRRLAERDAKMARRLAYTGFTRAKSQVVAYDVD